MEGRNLDQDSNNPGKGMMQREISRSKGGAARGLSKE
jgi:hypothetical protein